MVDGLIDTSINIAKTTAIHSLARGETNARAPQSVFCEAFCCSLNEAAIALVEILALSTTALQLGTGHTYESPGAFTTCLWHTTWKQLSVSASTGISWQNSHWEARDGHGKKAERRHGQSHKDRVSEVTREFS